MRNVFWLFAVLMAAVSSFSFKIAPPAKLSSGASGGVNSSLPAASSPCGTDFKTSSEDRQKFFAAAAGLWHNELDTYTAAGRDGDFWQDGLAFDAQKNEILYVKAKVSTDSEKADQPPEAAPGEIQLEILGTTDRVGIGTVTIDGYRTVQVERHGLCELFEMKFGNLADGRPALLVRGPLDSTPADGDREIEVFTR